MHFATLLRPIQDHQSTGATGDAAVLDLVSSGAVLASRSVLGNSCRPSS
jgi:hypothetical protein